jgi:hypothetical protein
MYHQTVLLKRLSVLNLSTALTRKMNVKQLVNKTFTSKVAPVINLLVNNDLHYHTWDLNLIWSTTVTKVVNLSHNLLNDIRVLGC